MLHITVKTLDSQNHSFTCDEDISVRGFKEYIAETVSVSADSQRLIYCGRVLQDDKKLKDYGNVNDKVIHLVQRVPPQPESRSNNSDAQRQNNGQLWPDRVQYRGHLHRNAMYLGAMSVPAEVVEGRGLPVPQFSNTLSNSRLLCARRMLHKAEQLMNRLDDPSVPLHPSPTENNAAEPPSQASAPEEETTQYSNINSSINSVRNGIVQAASEIANAFSAAVINIGLSADNHEDRSGATGLVNESVSPAEQTSEATGSQTDKLDQQPSESKEADSKKSEAKPERSESERSESERVDASTSNNNNQNSSRRSTLQVPRPPQMGNLLDKLISTQDRLRPYIGRYRNLMLSDSAATGSTGVADNQRIVDGVSECLHYLSHACHAMSDIIVDMGQQPPRNLRCRPIIIQHSAILQAGIPIQLESHINLSGRVPTNNNTTDEGNEATRPSSPSAGSSDQTTRQATNNRSSHQNANGPQIQSSLFGTFLNLPSNIELSMELNPQSAMDFNSPNAADGTENEQGQSNNNNNIGNVGGSGGAYSMAQPFALIRDALQSVLSERHSQMETSNNASINIPPNIPFVTIVGQQMDIGMPNSGQSTQARSNIGTHPTTSTQTRSTARPHVLHPHTHPYNVGVGMGQSLDFDPILPCNSHHIRRSPPSATNSASSQSNQANQATASEGNNRTQSATSSSSTSTRNSPQSHAVNFTIGGDPNAAHIELAMTLGELFQAPARAAVEFSLIESVPNASEISLAELLRSLNVRLEEFTGRNFLIDLWLFWLRNVTFGGLVRLSLGQSGPLVNVRRPLREFLEHSFPDTAQETLQERIVEQIITLNRPYLQALTSREEVSSRNRRVDVLATIEALLRKFCLGFLKLLFNNDLDDLTFAQEAVALAKKLEDQTSAVLQYVFQGGQTTLETIASRFINQLTEGIHPLFQQTLLDILQTRIRTNAARTPQTTESEITALLIYLDEPSAPTAESEETVMEEVTHDVQVKPKPKQKDDEAALPQSLFQPQVPVKQDKKDKKDKKDEKVEHKSEPMDTGVSPNKIVDDSMDLSGEEIPETFPGAENLPPEWVPIIARDQVYQRRQSQLQTQQGGPIPFSDAYLSSMPSKRRKLIEQQKPQLLANPTANSTAITASVERLVREGIGHSHLEEATGAANAVAAVPAVRSAFGQAIKDCLHPSRLRTPDFPNASRFPNASKYFADCDKDKEGASKPPTATKTSK